MDNVLEIEGLKKEFRSKVKSSGFKGSLKSLVRPDFKTVNAVDDISFSVEKGEITAFIGPNGAGKSTTIKLMTGILYPDSGHISVLGMDPHRDRKKLAYRIGTVFGQKSQLWYHLPPADSFDLLGSIYNMSESETKKRVDYLTEVFEIGKFVNQAVRKLSLGQRIRCEIAASLIHSPEILFLDEPTIGLDVVVKQKIRDLILRINRDSGVTVFLTSHDTGDIEKICRRAIVINEGQLVWDGSVKDMKYTLLNKRIINVRLEEPLDLKLEGVDLLKAKGHSAKLEVDLSVTSMKHVIPELVNRHNISDISISTILLFRRSSLPLSIR
ncbi:MAG: ATP-binding cassette domain-containing protein [Spirochaetales bacterium]|nr:ATP-binding cassette domain-containing protein [Spirochaetales bacterium]